MGSIVKQLLQNRRERKARAGRREQAARMVAETGRVGTIWKYWELVDFAADVLRDLERI